MKTGCITAGRYTIRLITHNYRCKDQQREKEVETGRRNTSVQEKCSRASLQRSILISSVKSAWKNRGNDTYVIEKKLLNVDIIFLYLYPNSWNTFASLSFSFSSYFSHFVNWLNWVFFWYITIQINALYQVILIKDPVDVHVGISTIILNTVFHFISSCFSHDSIETYPFELSIAISRWKLFESRKEGRTHRYQKPPKWSRADGQPVVYWIIILLFFRAAFEEDSNW